MSFRSFRSPLLAGLVLAALLLAGCSVAPPRTDDPLERFNRRAHAFNQAADEAFIRPLALTYRKVTSPTVRRLVANFFANVRMPVTIVNDVLQGEARTATRNTGRFLINTTLGFAGLFDPASAMNLPPDETDFGVTLAKWGVPEGPYLVLPLVGPTTARDVWRMPVDAQVDPLSWYARRHHHEFHAEYLPYMVWLITLRSRGIDAESLLDGVYDPYVFFRDAYRQRRIHMIYDGEPPPEVIERMQGVDDDLDIDALLEEQYEFERGHEGDD